MNARNFPWLHQECAALADAHARGRLPHSLLIHDAVGAGGEHLALWVAQLALCRGGTPGCGECPACRRVVDEQHPDLMVVRPVEDSKQIRIEQVRELAESLGLSSHQGGYRVGILSPADAMNRFGANALLKTLEEPPPRSVLILVATQPSRLPATILSRCQRIRIRPPAREQSREWLTAVRGPGQWDAVLDTVGEAPLLAADLDPAAVAELAAETRRTLAEIEAGAADPAATAERWARSELPLRLTCIENWLTERIRSQVAGGAYSAEVRPATHLSRAGSVMNIRALFALADGVRELKALLETPINRALALESLLRRLGSRNAPGGPARAAPMVHRS